MNYKFPKSRYAVSGMIVDAEETRSEHFVITPGSISGYSYKYVLTHKQTGGVITLSHRKTRLRYVAAILGALPVKWGNITDPNHPDKLGRRVKREWVRKYIYEIIGAI